MRVAIDAGHGSNTSGKRTPEGYREHWANVKVANYFAEAMERNGIDYIKVGWNDSNATDDADTALSVRQAIINAHDCDYSVSFHFNASGDGKTYNSAQGIETLVSIFDDRIGDSMALANAVQKYLVQGTEQKNRGVKRQDLAMCNCKKLGTKASILIECGFMTNLKESILMQSDAFCKECAEETAKGFLEYIGKMYVPTDIKNPDSTFLIKLIVDMNIRESYSVLSKKVGEIKAGGVYTIVETKGSWGRLKSGAGWINISSNYVRRL